METNNDGRSRRFKIITLNCWGLLYISKFLQQRIKFIAHHLNEQNYDFVFLQEVWTQSHFDYIRTTTASKYPFAHLFRSSSVLGNSGLAIFSKYKPTYIHFEPFIINGTPFRPWHGDWFTGKGVAYARLHVNNIIVHLFNCHMHAQYSSNEQLDAQYSIHRVCQAYQLAKFINLMNISINDSNESNLFVVSGDLNTASNELPYRLLISMTGLIDSYNQFVNYETVDLKFDTNYRILAKYFIEDKDLITCGHRNNTFTENTDDGKRIDFILYKWIPKKFINGITGDGCNVCSTSRVECYGKDLDAGLSFSDHQPVAIELDINNEPGPDVCVSALVDPVKSLDSIDLDIKSEGIGESNENELRKRLFNASPNVKLDSNLINGSSLNNENSKHNIDKLAKLYPSNTPNDNSIKSNNLYLLRTQQLLTAYAVFNGKSKKKYSLSLLAIIVSLIVIMALSSSSITSINTTQLLVGWFSLIIGGLFMLLVIDLIFRFEQNAITSVLEDVNCFLNTVQENESSHSLYCHVNE